MNDHMSNHSEHMSSQNGKRSEKQKPERHTLLHVVGSVLAAGFGVQSSKNRERDFKHGRAAVFIVAGIVFTLGLLGTLYAVVSLVLQSAA